MSTLFVRRLGPHHFAHLRCFAELGLDGLIDSARRYLGINHGHEAKTAHQQTVDAVRAVARRKNEKAWRLIGLPIPVATLLGSETLTAVQPSLDDFIADRDLDGWSESEVADMYLEAYPPDKKTNRRQRLRARQLDLLQRLQTMAAEVPLASDLVNGWFNDVTSNKLLSAGITTLEDLNRKLAIGGRWFASLPGVGETKARQIESHLATLLPRELRPLKPLFALVHTTSLFASTSRAVTVRASTALPFSASSTAEVQNNKLLSVNNDSHATEAWINARAGSNATAKSYRREARRLLLWLQYECNGKSLVNMDVPDCSNYMTFLQNIPERWISREHAKPNTPGWAPFRGPLSHKSHRQAVVIVASMFTWLQSAQYIGGNPWLLVNQKTGDDRNEKMLDTKALSEMTMIQIMTYVEDQAPSPSRSRIRFILRFMESVGLRSAELLNAKLTDFHLEPEGWVMQIHGKGSKNRIAVVPGLAFDALQDYLMDRGLGDIQNGPPHAPLLASTRDPMEPVGYQALYEHVKRWLYKAISASNLPMNERLRLSGASTHWLRHTFGTRAIAREVPLDVIQAQMGHASIMTTTAIYGRAPVKRRVDELGKAFR